MAGMFGAAGYGPSNWADTLTLIGAGLKDASPTSQGGNLAAAQQMLMQRRMFGLQQQALGQLGGLFGGQAAQTVGTASAPAAAGASAPAAASGPDFNRIAAAAPYYKALGIDLAPSIEALKAGQPHVMVTPSGEAINDKDASVVGKTFPSIEKGQIVLRDVHGNVTGVMNLPGAVDAAAQTAGAVAGAQEQAKAPYDLVDVPLADGSTVKMPRSIAASMLAKRFAAGSGAPQATGAAEAADAALGQTQTPAAAELAKQRATTQAQREQLLPKETAALQDLDNRSALTSQIIHQILGDVQDPKSGQWKPGGKPMINALTTGVLGGNLEHIWQPAANLDAQLEHIRAMTALDELQKLREQSPTGAGLGRVTQQEINLLAAMRGSIDQHQSTDQMGQNLRRQLGQLDQIRANRHQEYQQTYGGLQAPTPGQTAPIPPGQHGTPAKSLGSIPLADRIAEARRRGLIQ